MKAVKHSEGRAIDYVPDSDVNPGDVVVIGDLVAVAPLAIAGGTLGAVDVEGVFCFPKATTSSSAINAGAKLYWDEENQIATTTSGSNKTIGYSIEAAAADDAYVNIKLGR